MIILDNGKPPVASFEELMREVDNFLNEDAKGREDYYCKRKGKLLEEDVYEAVRQVAAGSVFEGSVQLVSGLAFPDIVANKIYGIEVKSTEKDQWTSIGSSILESTRIEDVERIYLTFGKLGKPVRFLSRPYEECLGDIAVTHYPRYKIDMRLKAGETIFEKMGTTYDELRNMENPVVPVSKYYKNRLKEGESLWWAAGDTGEESAAPATVRLWTALTYKEKEELSLQGYLLFPEVFGGSSRTKYNRFALWLATQRGVVNTSVRDSVSAGGQVFLTTRAGVVVKMPASFGRIAKHSERILALLNEVNEEILAEYWGVKVSENRLEQWCRLVAQNAPEEIGYAVVWSVLSGIFPSIAEK